MKKNPFRSLGALVLAVAVVFSMLSVPATKNAEAKGKDLYTVMILNNSGDFNFLVDGEVIYTAETAVEQVKKGAKQFLNILSKTKKAKNAKIHVAIITYDMIVKPVTKLGKFTTDLTAAKEKVSKIKVGKLGGGNNLTAALYSANLLLKKIAPDDAVKNTVLFTNGMVSTGVYDYSGHYDENTVGSSWKSVKTGVHLYAYANKAYEAAKTLKEQGKIYTIGFFDSFEDMPEEGEDVKAFFELTAKEIASKKRFLSVTNVKKIVEKFKEAANDVVAEWTQH